MPVLPSCHRGARPGRRRRPSVRPGFILLFGSRNVLSDDSSLQSVQTQCPRCSQMSTLRPRRYRTWFTLFFIPIFPMSGSTQFTQCSNCNAQFPITTDQLRQSLAEADQQQNQRAIALYNSLRASPANSVTLNELMLLYASLNDHAAALSAAGEFPDALNNSEQCMTTLGRVYLAQNRHGEALQWFDAAIARNPNLGEAQYYKALAHLLNTPSAPEQAVTAARAARAAGHPNADALLKEAEAKARA